MQTRIVRILQDGAFRNRGGVDLAPAIIEQLDRADRQVRIVIAVLETRAQHAGRAAHAASILQDFRQRERRRRVACIVRQNLAQQALGWRVALGLPVNAGQSPPQFGRMRMLLQRGHRGALGARGIASQHTAAQLGK